MEGFYETQYSSKVINLNFFLLIRYDDDHLDFWYKDSKNNKKCFLYDLRFNKEWIKRYGDICKSMYTKKTIDWVYEEEARAIIFDHNYKLGILKNKKAVLNDQFKIYQAYFSKINGETKINIHKVDIDF